MLPSDKMFEHFENAKSYITSNERAEFVSQAILSTQDTSDGLYFTPLDALYFTLDHICRDQDKLNKFNKWFEEYSKK